MHANACECGARFVPNLPSNTIIKLTSLNFQSLFIKGLTIQEEVVMKASSYNVVYQGLDTLHLVYQGPFNFYWWQSADLKAKKLMAQKKKDKPFVRFGDDIWEVSERGTSEYTYCLIRNGWRVYLLNSKGMNPGINQMKVEVPSARLRVGDLEFIEEIRILCCQILSSFSEHIQRVDIAVDVEGFGMEDFSGSIFYGYPKKMQMINSDLTNTQFVSAGNPGKAETLMIGKNPLLRIYDKKKLAIKQDRDWFHTWYGQSYESILGALGDEDQIPPITRFEFQIRSNILKEFRVGGFQDFWKKRQGIYDYLTNKWIECKVDDPGKESKRRLPTATIWKFLRNVEFAEHVDVKRERSCSYASDVNIKQIVGHLSSYCAKKNLSHDPAKHGSLNHWLLGVISNDILRSPDFSSKDFETRLIEKTNRLHDFKPPQYFLDARGK